MARPLYERAYGSTWQRWALHPSYEGELGGWDQSASSPAAGAYTGCERFWNTAPRHLNARAVVVNGARRVSSWHATHNVHRPRLDRAWLAVAQAPAGAMWCPRTACAGQGRPWGEGAPPRLIRREVPLRSAAASRPPCEKGASHAGTGGSVRLRARAAARGPGQGAGTVLYSTAQKALYSRACTLRAA
jgi:hypothetical protein